MGRPAGYPKTGGRQKGSTNKPKAGVAYVKELLEAAGINTFLEQAKIALGAVPCSRCKSKGTIRVRKLEKVDDAGKALPKPKLKNYTEDCHVCQGTGREHVPIAARSRALADLNAYQQPRLSHATLEGDLTARPGLTLEEMLARERNLMDTYPEGSPPPDAPKPN